MLAMLEFVGVANAVFGLILTLFGAAAGVFVWIHRRMKAVAANVMKESDGSHANTVNRVVKLEDKVEGLSGDIGEVRDEVHDVGKRLSSVEMGMETVARQKDVAELAREVSGMKSASEIQNSLTSQFLALFREVVGKS